jgi:hypothetical protein
VSTAATAAKMSSGAHTWTVRTVAALTKDGWMSQRVESYNTFSHHKNDLFGIIDVLAVRPGYPTRGIQVTSHANASTRMNKILGSPAAGILLASGWWLEVWGWKKDGRLWVHVDRNVSEEAAKRMTMEER